MRSEFIEKFCYWIVWIISTVFALYTFCLASQKYRPYLHSGDFRDGWPILQFTEQDVSDQEWTVFKKAWLTFWPWMVGHVVVCQLIAQINVLSLMVFYVVYSLTFICSAIGTTVAILYAFNVFLVLVAHRTGKKWICFLISFCILFVLHHQRFAQFRAFLDLDELQGFLLEVGLAWLNARCLSFALDRIDEGAHRTCTSKELVIILAYCFYLPYFFTGPILNYVQYVQQLSVSSRCASNYKGVFLTLVRYVALYYFLEFMLHFCYSSSIQFYPELVDNFDTWTLVGLGYSLPLLFCLKYKVIYGFVGAVAALDGLCLPPPPICITRVHLCSQLWKRFDRGLHLWIARYLYAPLAGRRTILRRVIASGACFAFMALWHGMQPSIFAWSFLNFVGVAAEMAISTAYRSVDKRRIGGETNGQRLQALFGTVCFVHMCIGCIFFLSSWEVGVIFYKKIFAFPVPLVPTLIIMYCGCHVSINFKGI